MGARELLYELRAAGISVAVEGDRLLVRPADRLTDSYRAALRAAKPEVINLLAGSDVEVGGEAFEERAAIMEFDGGMSQAEAEAAASELLRAIATQARRR